MAGNSQVYGHTRCIYKVWPILDISLGDEVSRGQMKEVVPWRKGAAHAHNFISCTHRATHVHAHMYTHKPLQVDPGTNLLQLARGLPDLAGAGLTVHMHTYITTYRPRRRPASTGV